MSKCVWKCCFNLKMWSISNRPHTQTHTPIHIQLLSHIGNIRHRNTFASHHHNHQHSQAVSPHSYYIQEGKILLLKTFAIMVTKRKIQFGFVLLLNNDNPGDFLFGLVFFSFLHPTKINLYFCYKFYNIFLFYFFPVYFS